MNDYICIICGYIYHPKENKNISFEELPTNWVCPLCQAKKEEFKKLG